MASAFEHLDQPDLNPQGADDERRVESVAEGDIDKKEPSADGALRLVLHAHESRNGRSRGLALVVFDSVRVRDGEDWRGLRREERWVTTRSDMDDFFRQLLS